MGRVEGKVALITGAARGQGRSHALRLAEEGADIIAVDVCGQLDTVPYAMATEADLEETAKQVEDRDRRILTRQADVRDLGQLQAAVAGGVSEFGHLDIVCANAGIGSMGPAWELSEETWQDMIDVNLTGVWKTVKAAVPQMIEQGSGGSIILTSSIAGLREPRPLCRGQARRDRADAHARSGARAAPDPGQLGASHDRRHRHDPE
jgi:NAD(P)-dependent dehydrogenase (short-subunit alcohol dehydrogenase family)